MLFSVLLGFSALFVAGCAAYFSVLGIATLFSGHFIQVLIMASSLEIGKIVATSFLYRYWHKTALFLKAYLLVAVLILMGITSMGIFGYLSSGYQVNAGKTELIDNKAALIVQQKDNVTREIEQINSRIDTLNAARKTQEERLPSMSRLAAKPVYEDMARSAEEIKRLTTRIQELQTLVFEKDNELIALNSESNEVHDIGTFKFVAESVGLPLDTVVKLFIVIIVCVFDPLAIALILAYNVAVYGRTTRDVKTPVIQEKHTSPVVDSKQPTNPETSPNTGIHLSGHLKN